LATCFSLSLPFKKYSGSRSAWKKLLWFLCSALEPDFFEIGWSVEDMISTWNVGTRRGEERGMYP